MNSYERAGRLLALAAELKAEGILASHVAERAAEVAATQNTDAALGFVEGWWYASGNRTPGNNEAWRRMRELLGATA